MFDNFIIVRYIDTQFGAQLAYFIIYPPKWTMKVKFWNRSQLKIESSFNILDERVV